MGDLGSLVGTGTQVRGWRSGGLPRDRGAILLAASRDAPRLLARARIRVTPLKGSPPGGAAVAQANLEIDGLPVRVQTVVDAERDAADALCRRLAERLARLARPGPRSWAHPREFGRYFEQTWWQAYRPRISRRKAVVLRRQTMQEAAFHLDAMDYDCHLFSDAESGQDCMVHRCGPAGYGVARLSAATGQPERRPSRITVSPSPAPQLSPREAAAQLRRTGRPFLFFADAWADRPSGAIVYQRYDGHFGLIFPCHFLPLTSLHPAPGRRLPVW